MNQGGANADPGFVRQVARQASQNVTMGAQLADAVNMAIFQVQEKIANDFRRDMVHLPVHRIRPLSNDYLTIAGTIYSFVEPAEAGTTSAGAVDVALSGCTPFIRGGVPELNFSRILGKLPALPDPWSGQTCSWAQGTTHSSLTTYFAGDVQGYTDRFDADLGWVREYRALGLRNRSDYVAVTDSNTLSDTASYNLPVINVLAIESREGRTMGQAVLDLLSMATNQANLTAYGIGNYTSTGSGAAATANLGTTIGSNNTTVISLSLVAGGTGYSVAPTVVIAGPCTVQAVYTANVSGGSITSFTQVKAGSGYLTVPAVIISTLPSVTVNDCAALTVISPFPLTFAGERILQAIESLIQTCHPNHWLYVDAAGNIRILDQRISTPNLITLNNGANRWMLPSITRDLSDCYSGVIVRGGPYVTGITLSVLPWPGMTAGGAPGYVYTGPLTGGVATLTGGLIEDFGYAGQPTNADAIAAWVPSDYALLSLQTGQDQGTCTCTSTTQVIITSSLSPAPTYTLDQLDQTWTGQHAILTVFSNVITGVQQSFQRQGCEQHRDLGQHDHAQS